MEWTQAIITPVHKNGVASEVSNYRPLSLTYVACKLMKQIY